MNGIEQAIEATLANKQKEETKILFQNLIQTDQYVGELYSINYESAKIQIHDSDRQKVGGIPSLSFLIATRVEPSSDKLDFKAEDTSIILLRVMDATQLPNNSEAERIRVETAQRVSGDTEKHWDSKEAMDLRTKMYLSYAAVECRIIGTFYLGLKDENDNNSPLVLKFGSDISNFYPNRGLKVFKPTAKALDTIVNYFDKAKDFIPPRVEVGHIRYASTNRKFQLEAEQGQEIEKRYEKGVPVNISPFDLLSQKSAVFGMTRTGKSNSVKIIAKSVYELRYADIKLEGKDMRIGQVIFDPNGEYANENSQDKDGSDNPNALKNIWELKKGVEKENEVVTYGITNHPDDPDRKMMLLNFYLEDNLQIGKEIIDSSFKKDEVKFIESFKQVYFEKPEETDRSAITRYKRRVLAYISLLAKADFEQPSINNGPDMFTNKKGFSYSTKGIFSKELLEGRPNARTGTRFNGMLNYLEGKDNPKDKDNAEAAKFRNAALTFQKEQPSLKSLANSFSILYEYMNTNEYRSFERWYVEEKPNASGDTWADEDLKKILEMIWRPNGAKQIGKVRDNHSPSTSSDYANDIWTDLKQGKLVIIDQSSGEPELNKSTADRIMWHIFRQNQSLFREGKNPREILVYIEEAHNLLPSGSDLDLQNIWVRTAKEGAKYHIGMVYSTQEVSSIQKNILKNTANWFIGHLNNTDETKELCKYYDFADFESSIRRTQDKGFLRIKTLSNYFVIPVQVKLFDVTEKN